MDGYWLVKTNFTMMRCKEIANHMQKQILKAATILSFVVALTVTFAAVPAAADSFGSIRVDVPFEFSAGHSVFPAGKYTIRPAGVNTNGVIWITSEDGKAGLLLTNSAESVQPKNETALIFHRYGDQYFLFQVWVVGDTLGREIPKSSMERQAVRAIEVNKGQSARSGEPAEVIIAARKPSTSK
jgi:hypothetical protein